MQLSADVHASAAQNASFRMKLQVGVLVPGPGLLNKPLQPLWLQPHLEKPGYRLEIAFLVGGTLSAVHIMRGEEKLEPGTL